MDVIAFESTLKRIRLLDASEGPSRNVLEPKFEARDQILDLQSTVLASHTREPSQLAQRQLCKIASFLGTNYYETEEDAEAEKSHCNAFRLANACLVNSLIEFGTSHPITLSEVIQFDATPLQVQADWANAGCVMIEVLNAVGVFLSSRSTVRERVEDARKVLHTAEQCAEFTRPSLSDKGELEKLNVNTQFYLAQVYTGLRMMPEASKYCHLTMARQMRFGLDFSKKEWATNAVHLAGYYASEDYFGAGLHCLQAARAVMPTTPADEETLGVVAWGFGKFYKTLLRKSAVVKASGSIATPQTDSIRRCQWWVDFPVDSVAPPSDLGLATSFEGARDIFRLGVKELQSAAEYYAFETCCPDHIAIHQDIGDCYKWLMEFEPDVERQAAMIQRRIDGIAKFPDQLSFTAYATLIRQLLFDLGDIATDLFDLRLNQKLQPSTSSKPLSDKKINEIGSIAKGYFVKFLESFAEKDGTRPVKVDQELKTPIFRALMRVARLESKVLSKTPEDEFNVVAQAIKRYDDACKFADDNNLERIEDIVLELKLAREMKALLPGKQRDIMRAFKR